MNCEQKVTHQLNLFSVKTEILKILHAKNLDSNIFLSSAYTSQPIDGRGIDSSLHKSLGNICNYIRETYPDNSIDSIDNYVSINRFINNIQQCNDLLSDNVIYEHLLCINEITMALIEKYKCM